MLVSNAQDVEFAKEKGIAIYARATQGPLPGSDPSSDGTVVRKSPPRMPGTVVGVASERDLLVLDGDAPPADVLALLAERGSRRGPHLQILNSRRDGQRHLLHLLRRRWRLSMGRSDRTGIRFEVRFRDTEIRHVIGRGLRAQQEVIPHVLFDRPVPVVAADDGIRRSRSPR